MFRRLSNPNQPMSEQRILYRLNRSLAQLGTGLLILAMVVLAGCSQSDQKPLKIGVIHATTGTMATNETPLINAVKMAVDELNEQGGVLGRRVEVIVADSQSNPEHAAREAERLLVKEKVSALFACWTSTCRKAVKPVVETHKGLMFYPVQYEGLEESPNILYTGATANQQIIPGAVWAFKNLGKRIFLVGSDYLFPRTANQIIQDLSKVHGATILGEHYRPLGSTDFSDIAAAIQSSKPDVILNTINGSSNIAFFNALQHAGAGNIPVMSFSVDASNLSALAPFAHDPHYTVWGYFQELPGKANQHFVANWQQRVGLTHPTTDSIEASYIGVKLWAQAVEFAHSADVEVVNLALTRQSIAAPSGILAVDAATRHLWKPVRIGKARADGEFEIVFDLGARLRPKPYPGYRPRDEWNVMAHDASQSKATP